MTKLSNGWMTFTDLMSQIPSKSTKARGSEIPQEQETMQQKQQQPQRSPQTPNEGAAPPSTETQPDLKTLTANQLPSTQTAPLPSTTAPQKNPPSES